MKKRNRKETITKLLKELTNHKDKNIEELMRKREKKKLKEILKSIDYSFLNLYFKKEIYLDVEMDEIPKDYLLEFVLFLHGNSHSDSYILRNYKELQKALQDSGGELESKIAKKMKSKNLNEISLKKLLAK